MTQHQVAYKGQTITLPMDFKADALAPQRGETPTQYQVAYEGQILTLPMDFKIAAHVAACENCDALCRGHEPLAEVVLAPREVEPWDKQ